MHKSRNYFKTALNEITLHFLILAWVSFRRGLSKALDRLIGIIL